ncbi:MAG: tyrosine-type recombinase/integrase [Rhodospirillales bacterium]|jgi:integrase|nr:tyrosine-type recombinase/integrase [Rhodospirillales bacterium]
MAREVDKLSALQIKSLNKVGRYSDGNGLYLQISRFDTKAWIFRFTLNGKPRQMGLGPIDIVSLKEAREEANRCRKLVHQRIDPIDLRSQERSKSLVSSASIITFQECAEKYIDAHISSWKNAKHGSQWRNTLTTYAFPILGNIPIQDVSTGMVLEVLEPIWTTKTETASRVRGRMESILGWAKSREYRKGENPARWKDHLGNILPQKTKVSHVKHHAALPYEQIGRFMEELRSKKSNSSQGLELLILTATRTGEVIHATWNEIDFNKQLWTIPAERTKTKKEHRVPLSGDAMNVLIEMKKNASSDYIFPGARKGRPLSNMAFLQCLKRMGRGDLTAHGFRSSFRDWAAEQTNYPSEVAEMALAHTVGDKVEAAYRRGDLYNKRCKIMESWAKYCATIPGDSDNVISIYDKDAS